MSGNSIDGGNIARLGMGLAILKSEGAPITVDGEGSGNSYSRWIELNYDSGDDTGKIDSLLETMTQLIDANLISGAYEQDDVHLLITNLAHKFIKDYGA